MNPRRPLGCSLLLAAFVAACGGSKSTGAKADAGARPAGSTLADAGTRASDGGVADAGQQDAAPLPKLTAQDMDWQENERSRDPFRSFARLFADEAKNKVKSQREVMLDQYPLDSLKLIGIVLRANPPLAMLVDPTGKGHTVKRGQFVGRAEIVQAPGQAGAAYEVNWRLESIRDGDVVFVREDPQNPDVAGVTKVIPLRPEGEVAPVE